MFGDLNIFSVLAYCLHRISRFLATLWAFTKIQNPFLSYFFVKKIPLSRRVEYVKDGSMDHSVSELVSERCMYVTPIRSDLL